MNSLFGLISLSALLLAVSGQLSHLSPSYTIQGVLARVDNGVVTSLGTYSVSVDVTRRLQFVDETLSNGLVILNTLRLSSENDNATYLSVDSVCNETAFDPAFPIDPNVWGLYAAGIESPAGTYTFTDNGVTHQVVIVDGLPTFLGLAFGNTAIVITVTNFYNTTPEFSTFSLPSECSQLSCNACYNSAVSVSISILMLLTTLLMYLLTTL